MTRPSLTIESNKGVWIHNIQPNAKNICWELSLNGRSAISVTLQTYRLKIMFMFVRDVFFPLSPTSAATTSLLTAEVLKITVLILNTPVCLIKAQNRIKPLS